MANIFPELNYCIIFISNTFSSLPLQYSLKWAFHILFPQNRFLTKWEIKVHSSITISKYPSPVQIIQKK